MRNFLVLFVVLLSGCGISVQDRQEEMIPVISQKRALGEMLVNRMEEEVLRLAEEQAQLNIMVKQIKKDLQSESEWIQTGREVDKRELCKF
jgi:hypothetical protein